MSYRAVPTATGRLPRGDVRDVAKGAATVVGALSNPLDAVLNFIGGQLLSGIFGQSEQDVSIAKFKQRQLAAYQKLAQRLQKNPRAVYRQIRAQVTRAKRNPKLRFR